MAGFYSMRKMIWNTFGLLLLGIAYIGLILPGLPFSPFLVGAAVCFSKSNPKLHNWMYNHPVFGPFLYNWFYKSIFPSKMKYMMVAVMAVSLGILWSSTHNLHITLYSLLGMSLVAIWAWRFPGSEEEYNNRITNNKKIGWIH